MFSFSFLLGAGRSSEVERSLMVRWVVGSIVHGVDPLSYFSFQPVLHDWCNKGRGMCYPVCGMVHIKEPLLLIDKSSLCGGSGFPFSLSEWSLTIFSSFCCVVFAAAVVALLTVDMLKV